MILLFVNLFNQPSHSRQNAFCSYTSLAEKIYLQLDGKVYTTDNIIWFKSIVANAVNHAPTKLSGVLYVELINPDAKVVDKKIVKIENGIGYGFFELNPTYSEGNYTIRAYTEWNKNFDSDFIFKEDIQVFALSTKEKVAPIKNVTLIEKQKKERWIKADFYPLLIDSLQKKYWMNTVSPNWSLVVKKSGTKKKNGHMDCIASFYSSSQIRSK